MLSVITRNNEISNLEKMNTKLDIIEKALAQYANNRDRLPCPASATDAPNTANFGKSTDCSTAAPAGTWENGSGSDTIRGGVIPVRSLGLADSYMFDEWGSRISYVMIKSMDTANITTFTTALTTGVIEINDTSDNQINFNTIDSVVAYALISHGRDKKGSYNKSGIAFGTVCDGTSEDKENCDNNDSIVIDSPINKSEIAANHFDDIVHWRLAIR